MSIEELLKAKTVPELEQMAKNKGLKGYSTKREPQLIEMLSKVMTEDEVRAWPCGSYVVKELLPENEIKAGATVFKFTPSSLGVLRVAAALVPNARLTAICDGLVVDGHGVPLHWEFCLGDVAEALRVIEVPVRKGYPCSMGVRIDQDCRAKFFRADFVLG